MTIPSGYTALDFVGYTDKGTYSASATYVKNDLVHYDNSIWRCLLDDTTGQTPAEGTCWTIFINASTSASGISYSNSSSGLTSTDVQNGIDELAKKTVRLERDVIGAIDQIVNIMYPIGSIYISTKAASPAELFGGTWEQIKDRFLLAAGDAYAADSTGGEAQHILTVDEMPSHGHDFDRQQWHLSDAVSIASHDAIITWREPGERAYTDFAFKGSVNNSGGGQPHNNMPPYLAIYVWKRVA